MNTSQRTRKQTLTLEPKQFTEDSTAYSMTVTLSWADTYHEGSNSFSVESELRKEGKTINCGCLHNEIEFHFPELQYLLKWHGISSSLSNSNIRNDTEEGGYIKYFTRTAESGEYRVISRQLLEYVKANQGQFNASGEVLSDENLLRISAPVFMKIMQKDLEAVGLTW